MFRRKPRAPRGQLVRLHTVTSQTFQGVLVATGEHYVLIGAKLLKDEGAVSSLVGNVNVPARHVAFFQDELPAGSVS